MNKKVGDTPMFLQSPSLSDSLSGSSQNSLISPHVALAACMRGETDVVAALLYAGADPNSVLEVGGTPVSLLQVGVMNGKSGVVEVLLDKGASPFVTNSQGASLLTTAETIESSFEGTKCVRLLQGKIAQLDQIVEWSAAGNFIGLKRLISHMTPSATRHALNNARPFARTALLLAACRGHDEVVDLLIEGGANVNTVSNKSKQITPLVGAAAGGHVGVIAKLTKAGAIVDYVSDDKRTACTPLCWAVLFHRDECVAALIAAGANVNFCTHTGDSPLLFAVEKGYLAIVKMLLTAGAEVLHANNSGENALSVGRDKPDPRIVEALRRALAESTAGGVP